MCIKNLLNVTCAFKFLQLMKLCVYDPCGQRSTEKKKNIKIFAFKSRKLYEKHFRKMNCTKGRQVFQKLFSREKSIKCTKR